MPFCLLKPYLLVKISECTRELGTQKKSWNLKVANFL